MSKIFFKLLDISGILLGIFLTISGLAVILDVSLGDWFGYALFIIGIGALYIHAGHYFNLKIARWMFGKDYFITRSTKPKK